MIDLLVGIGSAIVGFVMFLVNLVQGLLNIVSLVPFAFEFVGASFAVVPSFLVTFMSLSVILTVYLFILELNH